MSKPNKLAVGLSRKQSIPSLIKWTGSKRSLVPQILPRLPSYRRYIDPFVGGGALLYAATKQKSIAGDIYRPLMELWQIVQKDPVRVINDYNRKWKKINIEIDEINLKKISKSKKIPVYFYEVRDRFNRFHNPLDLNFIMRTCVNGIVRFNKKGEFNNSFHLSRRGMHPMRFERAVWSWHDAIQNVEFVCQDYETTLSYANLGDFVYLDPPYAGNKQRYIENLELPRFFKILQDLNERGVKWALSFDGERGERNMQYNVPRSLYKEHLLLENGTSSVNKVLNNASENIMESLYLNY